MIIKDFNPNNSYYFLTIVTKDRKNYFGEIRNGKMVLSKAGIIAYNLWYDIANFRPNLLRDEFTVMPNHVHGIIAIEKDKLIDSTKFEHDHKGKNSIDEYISKIIRSYKATVKKFTNIHELEFIWQEGYHNEYVWSEGDLINKRNYIKNNVVNWDGK